MTPQLTCPYGPRSCSIHTCSKSQHVSWQSVHKLMMVTENTLQMLKGTWSCHFSYLQKAGGSDVACCVITYLPLGRLASVKTQNPHLPKTSHVSRHRGPITCQLHNYMIISLVRAHWQVNRDQRETSSDLLFEMSKWFVSWLEFNVCTQLSEAEIIKPQRTDQRTNEPQCFRQC